MNQRNIVIWVILSAFLLVSISMFYQQPQPANEFSYSEFLHRVAQGQISEVTIQGNTIKGRILDGKSFQTYAPNDPKLVERLMESKVAVKASAPEDPPWYIVFLSSWAPLIVLVLIWVFFMRQMQGGNGKAMSFGRSRARMVPMEGARVTFENVAGVDEAKEELTEVVDFLSNPRKFTRLGGRIPKGVLLVGPPGTGKTLLARAVAGEAGVPFFSISGSDFVEMFVGVGASRVRDLFAQGKKHSPCLIFIDEIDAVGRQRGAGLGGGHDEREQTLNQLLVEMDGFEANEGVILIAATNRPDVLDPALMRPGRFDRQVVVPPPDVRGRRQILQVHAKRSPIAEDVDFEVLAKGTPGFSGADLENLVNEAALMAAKADQDFLTMLDFENAKDKLIMGKERRTLIQTPEQLKTTAYHEAGHAILCLLLPESDPLHKVTIIPRGRALGVTMPLPEGDRHCHSKTYLESRITMTLGGRAAEIIVFDQYTSGASNDIKQATKTARMMVCQLGMSDKVGPVAIGESSQEVFIGREWVASREHSEDTARIVDAEVKRIIDASMEQAEKLLRENLDALHRVSAALLERETINGSEVTLLMEGKELPSIEEKNGEAARKAAKKTSGKPGGNAPAKAKKVAPGVDGNAEHETNPDAAPDAGPGYEPDLPEEPETKQERPAERAGSSSFARYLGKTDGAKKASPLGAAATRQKSAPPDLSEEQTAAEDSADHERDDRPENKE